MPNVQEFVYKWKASKLTESAGSQSHFIELCQALNQPTPTGVDVTGESYTFEKGCTKLGGTEGWADVWYRCHFAWEYKGKKKNLDEAYKQLVDYQHDLENPPLLVVCDMEKFEVRTNFTYTKSALYRFTLDDLLENNPTPECSLPPLEVLISLFENPARLRPDYVDPRVTVDASKHFAKLADSLRSRGHSSEQTAHFLMRLLFCLFSEDIGLLPNKLFSRLVESGLKNSKTFSPKLRQLFAAMSQQNGQFGEYDIDHFDGGLFSDDKILELTGSDLQIVSAAASLDWAYIEPAIFGTLFERSLDPDKRSQLGAHYTSKEDILLIVEPVLMAPLRREWDDVRKKAEVLHEKAKKTSNGGRTKTLKQLKELLLDFSSRIACIRVLDPACGSGNFLYVSLRLLLDLEKEVNAFAITHGLSGWLTAQVTPQQLYGIETNVYAHELASVVVWIGYLQWLHENAMPTPTRPILKPLNNILRMDAVLAHDAKGNPCEPEWPETEAIVGNPPFLGGNKVRQELGDKYVDELFSLYNGRIPAFADYVCYWHERARAQVEIGKTKRAGLLATNSIRGGVNRTVLERIKASGDIFWAESDRDWILDGANVRVSMVAFDNGSEIHHVLDGQAVDSINPDLTSAADLTSAFPLTENAGICFMGPSAKGPFDVSEEKARDLLQEGTLNINGRPNSDVVRPVMTGLDLVRTPRRMWTIDFGLMELAEAAQYEQPFEYVKKCVYPIRSKNRRAAYAEKWWQYAEARPGMRSALSGKGRYIAIPAVAKHRIFAWASQRTLCNQGTLVFARDDDYFFGVLQSKMHELWSLKLGTALEDRPRYTPTTSFETFTFPWAPGKEPKDDPRVKAIADAARDLVEKRDKWLNPPGASEAELKKRTLTNLYNARPEWLALAHRKLDEAVLAAYGWPASLSDSEILERLLVLNHERAGKSKPATAGT